MVTGEAYEEFARPLRGRTAAQIRQLAKGENVALPNFKDVELLIKELWAFRSGQPSPTGPAMAALPQNADSPAASAVTAPLLPDAAAGDPQPTPPPAREVSAKRVSYWCVFRRWTAAWTRVPIDSLTDQEWTTLRADANIMIRDARP